METTVYRGVFIPGSMPSSLDDIPLRPDNFGIYWSTDFYTAWLMSIGQKGGFATPYETGYGLVAEANVDDESILNDYRTMLSRSDIMDMWYEGEEGAEDYIPDDIDYDEEGDLSPFDVLEEYTWETLPPEWLEGLRQKGYAWDEESSQFRYDEHEVTLKRGSSVDLHKVHIFDKYMRDPTPQATFDVNTTVTASILSPLRETLDPAIWQGDRLREEIKEQIYAGINDALGDLIEDPASYVPRVIVIGSITGLQYDEDADVDVNVLVDVEGMAEDLQVDSEELRMTVRKNFIDLNGELVPGTLHPVNYFLSVDSTYPPADGIYDVMTDTWIKRPGVAVPEDWDPFNSLSDALERAEQLAEKIDNKWGQVMRAQKAMDKYPKAALPHKRRLIRNLKALKKIFVNLHEERVEVMELAKKQGLDPPQMSTPNVVYKALEWWGALDILHKAMGALRGYKETGELMLGGDDGGF